MGLADRTHSQSGQQEDSTKPNEKNGASLSQKPMLSKEEKKNSKQGDKERKKRPGRGKQIPPLTQNDSWICEACKAEFVADDCKIMECEKCSKQFCLTCLDMSDIVYEYMGREDVLWCCQVCNKQIRKEMRGKRFGEHATVVEKIEEVDRKISNLEKSMLGLTEMLKAMEQRQEETQTVSRLVQGLEIPTLNQTANSDETDRDTDATTPKWNLPAQKEIPAMRDIIRRTMQEQEKELERKRNIIIHRLPEMNTNNKENKKKHDIDQMRKIMEAMNLDLKIERYFRLGKISNEQQQNPEHPKIRPLKVCFNTDDMAKTFMSKLSLLKDAEEDIKQIRVTGDMSLEEREEMRQLVEEAKNLTKQEKGNYRHIVRGKKIIRVLARPESLSNIKPTSITNNSHPETTNNTHPKTTNTRTENTNIKEINTETKD